MLPHIGPHPASSLFFLTNNDSSNSLFPHFFSPCNTSFKWGGRSCYLPPVCVSVKSESLSIPASVSFYFLPLPGSIKRWQEFFHYRENQQDSEQTSFNHKSFQLASCSTYSPPPYTSYLRRTRQAAAGAALVLVESQAPLWTLCAIAKLNTNVKSTVKCVCWNCSSTIS